METATRMRSGCPECMGSGWKGTGSDVPCGCDGGFVPLKTPEIAFGPLGRTLMKAREISDLRAQVADQEAQIEAARGILTRILELQPSDPLRMVQQALQALDSD